MTINVLPVYVMRTVLRNHHTGRSKWGERKPWVGVGSFGRLPNTSASSAAPSPSFCDSFDPGKFVNSFALGSSYMNFLARTPSS